VICGHAISRVLVPSLTHHGAVVDVPMANLTRGQQLAWLNDHA
jgi:hypothetical protein